MREFANLVLNESEKIYRKKRIVVVMLILAILIPLFVYAQYREIETTQKGLVRPIGKYHYSNKLLIPKTA